MPLAAAGRAAAGGGGGGAAAAVAVAVAVAAAGAAAADVSQRAADREAAPGVVANARGRWAVAGRLGAPRRLWSLGPPSRECCSAGRGSSDPLAQMEADHTDTGAASMKSAGGAAAANPWPEPAASGMAAPAAPAARGTAAREEQTAAARRRGVPNEGLWPRVPFPDSAPPRRPPGGTSPLRDGPRAAGPHGTGVPRTRSPAEGTGARGPR